MIKPIKIFAITLFLVSSLSTRAQQKFEKEEQISANEVPQQLKQIMQPFLVEALRIKYYLETDGAHESYEIKFSLDGRQYSVEFSNRLQLEDVEVVINLKSLESEILLNIERYLHEYDRYKIKRVQKQFSSESDQASSVIKQSIADSDRATIRYEIVADLKQGKSWSTEELLFDKEGRLIDSREVINRAEDFILFR